MPTTDDSNGATPRKRGRPPKGTSAPATKQTSNGKGRPKVATEGRAKRNFNFKKEINDRLKAESDTSGKAAITIVEEALRARWAMDAQCQSTSLMKKEDVEEAVKAAMELVLLTRLDAPIKNWTLSIGSVPEGNDSEGVVVELPANQLRVLNELAKRWNFDEPGDLLRSLAIGTINHPDNAHQLMFADAHSEKMARREESLQDKPFQEEEERKETRLRAA